MQTSDSTTIDQDMEAPHERVQATWPSESDFDLEDERFLNQGLDAPRPPARD